MSSRPTFAARPASAIIASVALVALALVGLACRPSHAVVVAPVPDPPAALLALDGSDGENIEGDYVRTVALERPGGLACASGQTAIELVDRYRVRGWIRDSRLEISEIAAEPSVHPCAPDEGRHLDVATVAAFRDHLVLRWRADRLQVLSRPHRE